MIYPGREDQARFTGMDVIVLPDDDERLKDIQPGYIGTDGFRFYVSETMWPSLKNSLFRCIKKEDGANP